MRSLKLYSPESDESNECMCTHVPSVLDIYKANDLHRKS